MSLRNSGSKSLLAWLAKRLPSAWIELLISKQSFFLGGLLSGLSLFVEEKRRREELAMYVMPKGMESAWVMARGKGWVVPFGCLGDPLLTAIGMGLVMVRSTTSLIKCTSLTCCGDCPHMPPHDRVHTRCVRILVVKLRAMADFDPVL